jgi:hypothetical protein
VAEQLSVGDGISLARKSVGRRQIDAQVISQFGESATRASLQLALDRDTLDHVTACNCPKLVI